MNNSLPSGEYKVHRGIQLCWYHPYLEWAHNVYKCMEFTLTDGLKICKYVMKCQKEKIATCNILCVFTYNSICFLFFFVRLFFIFCLFLIYLVQLLRFVRRSVMTHHLITAG